RWNSSNYRRELIELIEPQARTRRTTGADSTGTVHQRMVLLVSRFALFGQQIVALDQFVGMGPIGAIGSHLFQAVIFVGEHIRVERAKQLRLFIGQAIPDCVILRPLRPVYRLPQRVFLRVIVARKIARLWEILCLEWALRPDLIARNLLR